MTRMSRHHASPTEGGVMNDWTTCRVTDWTTARVTPETLAELRRLQAVGQAIGAGK